MKISPFAGKPAPPGMLVDVPRLITAYYTDVPDPTVPAQRVAFGTSGHRGSSFNRAFNEWHILAITQAICLYRAQQDIAGPLFLGIDTHALSIPGLRHRARGAGGQRGRGDDRRRGRIHADPGDFSRDPDVQSRAKKRRSPTGSSSRPRTIRRMTAASNTTRPNGGPADTAVTGWIEAKANALLEARLEGVKRIPYEQGSARLDDASARLSQRLHRRPRQRGRPGRHSRREDQPRRRSARRRRRPLLGDGSRSATV